MQQQKNNNLKKNDYVSINRQDFDAWGGAVSRKDRLLRLGVGDEFWNIVEEIFSEGVEDDAINNFLWFDEDQYLEILGIDQEDFDNAL